MDYQRILSSIKRGVFSPVYLLHGTEKLLINQVTEKIKSKILDPELEAFNLDIIDGEKTPLGQIMDLANTVPVISEKRVVIVNNPSYFYATAKGQDKGEEKVLLDYLSNPNLGCCLIFKAAGKVDKRKKIYKAIEQSGQVVEFITLDKTKLEEWITNFFKKRGKTIDPRALEYLALVGSGGLERLENELEKVDLYCSESPSINMVEVQEIVSQTPEINVFNLLDSIANKDGKKSIELLGLSLALGEAPMALIYRLASHFRVMLVTKDMISQGYSEKQIQGKLGVHPYTISKAIRQMKNFTMEQLIGALEGVLDTEIKLKTGAGDPKELLESLVIQLSYKK